LAYSSVYKQTQIFNPNALENIALTSLLEQLDPSILRRELNKAWIGFLRSSLQKIDKKVCSMEGWATGNWGCGAFGGVAGIKAIVQVMAISALPNSSSLDEKVPKPERQLRYCTFGDRTLYPPFDKDASRSLAADEEQGKHPLERVVHHLVRRTVTVSQLWASLDAYRRFVDGFARRAFGLPSPIRKQEPWMDVLSFIEKYTLVPHDLE
jgi:hypothetical protein